MPTEAIHQLQAQHNERLLRGLILLSPPFMDWAVTTCFYTALHLVDSYLARLGIHPHNHVQREAVIQRRLPGIRRQYWRLKRHSLRARYEGAQMNPRSAF